MSPAKLIESLKITRNTEEFSCRYLGLGQPMEVWHRKYNVTKEVPSLTIFSLSQAKMAIKQMRELT